MLVIEHLTPRPMFLILISTHSPHHWFLSFTAQAFFTCKAAPRHLATPLKPTVTSDRGALLCPPSKLSGTEDLYGSADRASLTQSVSLFNIQIAIYPSTSERLRSLSPYAGTNSEILCLLLPKELRFSSSFCQNPSAH